MDAFKLYARQSNERVKHCSNDSQVLDYINLISVRVELIRLPVSYANSVIALSIEPEGLVQFN